MKIRNIIVIVVLAFCMISVRAQQEVDNDTVVIKKSDLTPSQISKIQQNQLADKAKQYGSWIGVGHEIGTAVNESLSAVTTQANSFANTSVGKWTIALVVYKVVGSSLIGVFAGIIFFFITFPIGVFVYYKNCMTHRVLISDSKETGKKWQIVEPCLNDIGTSRFLHALILVGICGATVAMVFGSL